MAAPYRAGEQPWDEREAVLTDPDGHLVASLPPTDLTRPVIVAA